MQAGRGEGVLAASQVQPDHRLDRLGEVIVAAKQVLGLIQFALGDPERFSMLVAGRVTFLQAQVGVAINTEAEERHRDWAVREIEEALRVLPTPRMLADVLDMARRSDET